jgi:hypothetical protein
MNKKCGTCKEFYPISNFTKNISKSTGYNSQCRECRRIYFIEYRKTEKNKILQSRLQKNYKLRYPEKAKAHELARKYKYKLLKLTCEQCRGTKGELHMHHGDYTKPLKVITLCEPCHYRLHYERRFHY